MLHNISILISRMVYILSDYNIMLNIYVKFCINRTNISVLLESKRLHIIFDSSRISHHISVV